MTMTDRATPAPYYQDDQVTLYHGDCLELMRHMPDASVDIVVTSPPYNMGLVPGGNGRGMYKPGASNKAGRFRDGYGTHDDAMEQGEYDAWQREVLAECWRVARLAVFYNHRPRVEHGLLRDPLGNDFGIPLRQRIIWNRGTGIDVTLRSFCTRGEYVFFFAKSDMKLASHSMSGMGDVWDLGMARDEPDHPAPFPVALPMRCIEATGAQSVLDPFSGSGTTLRAAKLAGISGVGIDNEARWCKLAANRLSQDVLDFGGAVRPAGSPTTAAGVATARIIRTRARGPSPSAEAARPSSSRSRAPASATQHKPLTQLRKRRYTRAWV